MNYRIVKLKELSGKKTTIYSIILEGENETLFDKFVKENVDNHKSEVIDIYNRLEDIGKQTGAREGFFKLKEGVLGDLVCCLYDQPKSFLRLFCIRFSTEVILIGGGGSKPKDGRKAWQEFDELRPEGNRMIKISADILQRMKDKDIIWSSDFKELKGDLNFNDDEEE